MITKSFRLEDLERVKICIGYVGENEHTQVRIDCSSAFAEYPGATPALAVKPPRGGVYPAVIETEGNVVVWTVTNSDLLFRGEGEIQFSFIMGDVIKKTAVGKFDVHRSIITTANVPDPVAEWLIRATAAAAAAEAAAQHQPKIEGEYWYVWDSDAEEYVSTGVKAKGDKGDPGTPGDPTTLIDDTSTALNKTWSAYELDGLKNALHGKIDKSEIATQLETEAIINEYTEGDEDMIIEATYTNPVSGNPYFVTTDDADDIVNAYKNGKHIVARLKYVNEAETFGIHGDIYTSMLGYEPGYSKDGQTRLESFNFANGNCAIRTTFEAEGIGLIYKVYKNNNGKLVFEIYVD